MSKVAADAVPTGDYLRGREVGPPGTEAVFNVVVNPVADGLHARKAVGDLAELIPRKIHQLVRITIAAWQSITQQLMRQLSHGHDVAEDLPAVGQRRNGD